MARFNVLAVEGERLEPNNAYFSVMRAIGYFASHRDTEAIAAWKLAAEKPGWDDYVTEETIARIKLQGRRSVGDCVFPLLQV